MTCRWCGAQFSSRNQVFRHVRDSAACSAAAAAEDARAPSVLSVGRRPKLHACAFLVRHSCPGEAVVRGFSQALEAAGAQDVAIQRADGAMTGQELLHDSVFVAQFHCKCAAHSKRCGDDLLHRTYSMLSQFHLDVHASDADCQMLLLFASMIPDGGKLSLDQLCVQDHACLFPPNSPHGAPGRDSDALSKLASGDLPSVITVVVTTSPMRSDPDLDILETTFGSLSLAGLEGCRKILVCDHLNVDTQTVHGPSHAPSDSSNSGTQKFRGFKKGFLPPEYIARYERRLAALREADWVRDMNIELLELDSWHGFSLGTLRALELTATPLVCIIQHDLAFLRRVNMAPVADVLLRAQAGAVRRANFVNFPRILQQNYRGHVLRKNGIDVGPPVAFSTPCGSVDMTRLPQFLDGTHLARVDWYRAMFARALHDEAIRPMASVGSFQELTLGKYMFQLARHEKEKVSASAEAGKLQQAVSKSVLQVQAEFGGWLWNPEDPAGYLIYHLNSAGHYANWERERNNLPPSPFLTQYYQKVAAQAASSSGCLPPVATASLPFVCT